MIVSHKHKFIFLHNPKTAGTSINVALNPYLGPMGIQPDNWPDTIANGGHFNLRTRLLIARALPRVLVGAMKSNLQADGSNAHSNTPHYQKVIKRYYRNHWHLNSDRDPGHMTAEEIMRHCRYAWDNYVKFVVVRNPWSHAVSYYLWRKKQCHGCVVSFREFLERVVDPSRADPDRIRPPNPWGWPVYTIDDALAVDEIVRFENLREDLRRVGERIGISLVLNAAAKGNVRDAKKPLRDYYDSESIDMVRKIFAKEIAEFGYDVPFAIR